VDSSIGTRIYENGWRTGSVVAVEAMPKLRVLVADQHRTDLALRCDKSETIAVVVSQWCDLVHDSLADEPFCEIIVGQRVSKVESNRVYPRSYRHLDMLLPKQGPASFFAHDRVVLPRDQLLELQRSAVDELPLREALQLVRWVGSRYARLPLPNEMVRRLPFKSEPGRKYFKQITEKVREVRVTVQPADRELGPDESYLVVMYLIANSQEQVAALGPSIDKLKAWIKSLRGVNVQVIPVSMDGFSYAQILETDRLDLDQLTYGPAPGQVRGLEPFQQ
jgi:hypothetical protein